MTREELSINCLPFYAVAWALRFDLGTPNFPEKWEGYIAWVLTGIIAGLTPIVGPVAAQMLQGTLGSKPPVVVIKTVEQEETDAKK